MGTDKAARDVTRLPQWAQAELAGLAHSVQYWKERAGVVEGEATGKVWYERSILPSSHIPLPDGARVEFRVGSGRWDTICVSLKGDAIEIYSTNGTLSVLPHVSNVIHVELRGL